MGIFGDILREGLRDVLRTSCVDLRGSCVDLRGSCVDVLRGSCVGVARDLAEGRAQASCADVLREGWPAGIFQRSGNNFRYILRGSSAE